MTTTGLAFEKKAEGGGGAQKEGRRGLPDAKAKHDEEGAVVNALDEKCRIIMAEEDDVNVAVAKKRKKQRTIWLVLASVFLSMGQHIITANSEANLFLLACGQDVGVTARAMSTCTGLSGVFGLLMNQAGGKLSDVVGRKKLFLVGPLVNLLVAGLYHTATSSLNALIVGRSLKLMVTSFSGSVMSLATLMDVCTGQELAMVNGRLAAAIGAGVLFGNTVMTIERLGRHPLTGVKLLCGFSALQLLLIVVGLDETLAAEKRTTFAEFFTSLSSINPLSFLRLYTSKAYSGTLKTLATIQALQCCTEATCTRDIAAIYVRGNLGWVNTDVSKYFAVWGTGVSVSGMYVAPFLLNRLSPFLYTSFANLMVCAGFGVYGLQARSWCWWAAIAPFTLLGVNGGNTHAIKALAGGLAVKQGIGKGEFSAWLNNLRAIMTALGALVGGVWYARCQHGRFGGLPAKSVWWFIAVIGGVLPQLLCLSMPRKEFVLEG